MGFKIKKFYYLMKKILEFHNNNRIKRLNSNSFFVIVFKKDCKVKEIMLE